MKIATQTFGLSKELTEDLKGTIIKLHDIGFDGIEPFILFNETQGKSPKNLWALDTLDEAYKIMNDLNMEIPSAHIGIGYGWFSMPLNKIVNNIKNIHDKYGIENFVVSGPFGSAGLAKHWAKLTKKISDAIGEYGCKVIYHNHDMEFSKIQYKGQETTPMDIFLDNTSDKVSLELDVGWAALIKDVCQLITKYNNRILLIHLKDFYPEYCNENYNTKNMPIEAFVPIGDGGLKIKEMYQEIKKINTFNDYLIIDQDKSSISMLEALEKGYKNIVSICNGK